jgi:hypothetical protein
MPLEIHLDDVVQLRKPHPCGGTEWQVVRVGADIGIRCLTCGRRVLMPRREFERPGPTDRPLLPADAALTIRPVLPPSFPAGSEGRAWADRLSLHIPSSEGPS